MKLRPLINRLLHNWRAKLLALLAAMFIWYQLRAVQLVVEQTFTRPLQIIGLGVDRSVVGLPQRVQVQIKGSARLMSDVQRTIGSPVLDLSKVNQGPFNLPVQVQLPPGLVLVRANPDRVLGRVELVSHDMLPVRAYAPGESIIVEPPQVEVSGAESQVMRAAAIVATEVTPGRKISLIPVDIQGLPLSGLTLQPDKVAVTRRLPLTAYKTVPLKLEPPPGSLTLVSSRVPRQVLVMGSIKLLAALGSLDARVSWKTGSFSAPLQVTLPEGIELPNTVWGSFKTRLVQPVQ